MTAPEKTHADWLRLEAERARDRARRCTPGSAVEAMFAGKAESLAAGAAALDRLPEVEHRLAHALADVAELRAEVERLRAERDEWQRRAEEAGKDAAAAVRQRATAEAEVETLRALTTIAPEADTYELTGRSLAEITTKIDELNDYATRQVARWIAAEKEVERLRAELADAAAERKWND